MSEPPTRSDLLVLGKYNNVYIALFYPGLPWITALNSPLAEKYNNYPLSVPTIRLSFITQYAVKL